MIPESHPSALHPPVLKSYPTPASEKGRESDVQKSSPFSGKTLFQDTCSPLESQESIHPGAPLYSLTFLYPHSPLSSPSLTGPVHRFGGGVAVQQRHPDGWILGWDRACGCSMHSWQRSSSGQTPLSHLPACWSRKQTQTRCMSEPTCTGLGFSLEQRPGLIFW